VKIRGRSPRSRTRRRSCPNAGRSPIELWSGRDADDAADLSSPEKRDQGRIPRIQTGHRELWSRIGVYFKTTTSPARSSARMIKGRATTFAGTTPSRRRSRRRSGPRRSWSVRFEGRIVAFTGRSQMRGPAALGNFGPRSSFARSTRLSRSQNGPRMLLGVGSEEGGSEGEWKAAT